MMVKSDIAFNILETLHIFSLQFFVIVGWATGRASGL